MKIYNLFFFNLKSILLGITLIFGFVFYPSQSVLSSESEVCNKTELSTEIDKLCKEIADSQLQIQLLNTRKTLVDSEKDLLEARLNRFKLNLPNIDNDNVSALEGKVTFGELKYESTVLAYEAMTKAAEKIGNKISKQLITDSSVLIYKLSDSGSDNDVYRFYILYKVFQSQYQALVDAYSNLGVKLPTSTSDEALAEASLVAGSFIELARLFNVEREIQPVSVSNLTNDALAAQLFKVLKKNNNRHKIYYPKVHFYDKDSTNVVIKQIKDLYYLKRKAEDEISNLDPSSLRALKITKLNGLNDSLLDDNQITGDNQENSVISLAKGAKLFQLFGSGQKSYILYINVIAGGSNRSTRSILGGRLRHSGGVIVNYQFHGMKGEILDADYVRSYSGFRKVKKTY